MTPIAILVGSLVILQVSFTQGEPQTYIREYYTVHRELAPRYIEEFRSSDVNPCVGACGIGANCRIDRNNPRKAICSCPRGFTGHPFNECRPQTSGINNSPAPILVPADLCSPNPCGANAACRPGYDRTGSDRPVCTCYPGFVGDAVRGCFRGECESDFECPHNRICSNYNCQDPCALARCGVNANCDARNRAAVCSCPAGYRGDPFSQCTREPSRSKRTTTKEANEKVATVVAQQEEAPVA